MLALPPLFVVKMSDVCSLDVLETARVTLGFGETIWENVLARDIWLQVQYAQAYKRGRACAGSRH